MRQTIHGACVRKKERREKGMKENEGSEKEERNTREIKPSDHTAARDRDMLSRRPV